MFSKLLLFVPNLIPAPICDAIFAEFVRRGDNIDCEHCWGYDEDDPDNDEIDSDED
ncbi:hypothetical protein QUA82_09795 [Microcoleus sp. F8-D3]